MVRMAWAIETVPTILKSGYQAKRSRLRAAERLVNLLALFLDRKWADLFG
ncbi:hypothetical protein [Acidiferrobacter sp.]